MRSFDVAVVIVTYRTAELTIACLRSVQEERRASKEIAVRAIVVDNASGDAAVIRPALKAEGWQSWVTLIEAPVNGGFAYGNNLGVQHAYAQKRPDYVYVLNPDTEVRPGAIGSLVRFLEASPQAGIAGGSFEHLDGRLWPIAFRFPTICSELSHGLQIGIVSRLLQRWTVAWPMSQLTQPTDWICGAAMMIRPAVFDRIGGFDENYFLYFEETDFCHRARQAGYGTWYVPESRVMHIMGQSTKVTDEKVILQRFPAYWFRSRSRYFAVTFGVVHAMVIDLVAVLANCLGLMKRLALRRPRVPYYIRDLIRHSVLWPRNRAFPAVRGFRPGG
jgi:N-acetylglucosaminyl-diphospho-decaprenol L-rhamnosyltransferase